MSTQYSGKRRRTFDKPQARGRRAAGMLTIRQLGMFNPPARPRGRVGVGSSSVFQTVSNKPELKFIDQLQSLAIPFAGTGVSYLLNGCAQGTDANNHIGRTTTMKSLYWLWQGSVAPTTTGTGSLRMVILYDKESEGVAPTIAAGAQTDAFNQDNILAQQNLNNRDRFVVICDEIVEVMGTAGPQSFMRKGYRKVKLPCVFNAGAGATIAAINTGGIYAFFWDSGSYAVANIVSNLQTRIRFEDN